MKYDKFFNVHKIMKKNINENNMKKKKTFKNRSKHRSTGICGMATAIIQVYCMDCLIPFNLTPYADIHICKLM